MRIVPKRIEGKEKRSVVSSGMKKHQPLISRQISLTHNTRKVQFNTKMSERIRLLGSASELSQITKKFLQACGQGGENCFIYHRHNIRLIPLNVVTVAQLEEFLQPSWGVVPHWS